MLEDVRRYVLSCWMVKINWVIFRVPGGCFLIEEFFGLQISQKITSLRICTYSEALHVLSS